ncbi:MAG TPA: hypothetical protein VE777_10140 [Gaiellales bacterium]|nr:hypothetical protein [Gaiellales bacterium]
MTVTVSQVTFTGALLGSLGSGGYRLQRLPAAGGSGVTPAGACGVSLTGSAGTITCTEPGVAPGNWRYTVTPTFAAWSGATSSASSTATVAAPSLTLSSQTTFSALPQTLSGTASAFLDSEGLEFRLDDPTTGTVLSGSPSTIGSSGSASVTITIPSGTSEGVHTVYAVGAGGSQASASIRIAPQATDLSIANGTLATAHKPDTGDAVTITYSHQLSVATLCSTWTNDSLAQALTGATITYSTSGGTGTLTVTGVTAACGGTFHLGQITGLPSAAITDGTSATWTNSTIAWNPVTLQLTLTLGTLNSGSTTTVSTPSTATYAPDSSIASHAGTPIDTTTTPAQTGLLF